MRNGLKRHRIEIYSKSTTPNAGGIVPGTLTLVAKQWAEFLPMRAKEVRQGGKDTTAIRHTFVTDYNPSITEAMTLRHNGTDYNIISIQDRGGRSRQLAITVQVGK